MLLLDPVTSSQPRAAQREQTNTDGSFTFDHLRPGKYILLALDQAWTLNLADPTTLPTQLAHGTPINLTTSITLPHPIEALTVNR
jgi:hypothetical protein